MEGRVLLLTSLRVHLLLEVAVLLECSSGLTRGLLERALQQTGLLLVLGGQLDRLQSLESLLPTQSLKLLEIDLAQGASSLGHHQ